MKDKYIYPTLFNYDDDGISVAFPDLPGCLTCGDDDEDALYMAKDALRGHLIVLEDLGEIIPEPSTLKSIPLGENQRVVLIEVLIYASASNKGTIES